MCLRTPIIFDEALTHSDALTRWLPADGMGQFFQTRGGSLGVGFPGALGAQTCPIPTARSSGFPETAAPCTRLKPFGPRPIMGIGAKFVVIRNGGYRLLKFNLLHYWQDQGVPRGPFPWSFDIEGPIVDYVALAGSMGVPGMAYRIPPGDGTGPWNACWPRMARSCCPSTWTVRSDDFLDSA